jgi:beta-mannosidase
MALTPLTSGWTLHLAAGPAPVELRAALTDGVPATVPGVVHTDLLAAGLIPDPYVDDNEALLAWIGRCDWTYRTTFDAPAPAQRTDLVADGLDTVATVVLNGTEVARTRNQHRGYRWDIASLLRDGVNELRITFASAIAYAEEREAVLGERPHSYAHPFNAIRKTACNFGWDWGPALVTAGIWKRIGIETWDDVRIASVRPLARVGEGERRLHVHVELEWATAGAQVAEVRVAIADHERMRRVSREAGEGVRTSTVVSLDLPDVELWWPRGYGEQRLYDLAVSAGGSLWTTRYGFRSVELDVAPDEHGSPFALRVNGEPVYVRGANWIPDDTFFTRDTRESLAARFQDALDAGMNLLRVWGGGNYESEEFYALADELGVLVWQDFLLACAAYSEDAELWDEFEAEAVEAVTRLTRHPSLVLWNGGNENIWGYVDWNWRTRLAGRTWGEGYYLGLFPRIVAELAPGTPYSAGSPFGFSRYVHPNDPTHGTMHIWDVWNQVDYTTYRSYRPRFVSEFGFQGPPAWSTLFSVVHDEPADPYGPTMLVHQKANDGNGKLERGLGAHIAAPRSIEDWHWATQLNQARAVAYGIEHFRSLFPLNQGSIVWQMNDCWPVISWAAVDALGVRKPLWHALRRVYADRLASFQPGSDGGVTLSLHNDSSHAWEGVGLLRRLRFDGTELARAEAPVSVAAREGARLAVDPAVATADDPATEVLVADLPGDERAFWYFAEDPELALEQRPYSVVVRPSGPGYEALVTATGLVKDLTLLVDRVEAAARVDTALVTLLPGETHRFVIDAPEGIDPDRFAADEVVRSANDLVPALSSR